VRHFTRFFPIVALAALAACSDRGVVTAPNAPAFAASGSRAKHLTVMSRNMYIGADVDPVLQALVGGGDVLGALRQALAELTRTDFATRVVALADEIARARPQVVGLQEVWSLDVYPAALGLPGSPIHLDFLAALHAALAARGLSYVEAAIVTNTDATLAGGAVRLVDHDVLLIDPARVTPIGAAVANHFFYNLPLPPGSPIAVLRGYVAVPALVETVPVLLINTHLESGSAAGLDLLRAAQATELTYVAASAPTVIMTGDFNDVPLSPMYGVLAGEGLIDLWNAMRPGVAGLTCCHAPDLSNRLAPFDQRIDYVWTKGLAGPSGTPQGQIGLTGALPASRIAGAFGLIWPSDHAGVVATVLLPPPVTD